MIGPFYVPGSPLREYGESMVQEEGAGVPAWVYGRVLDVDGNPIAGAEVDVWQNGADMLYAVQRPEAEEDHLRGRYLTRDDGTYAFVAVRPVPYPIPHDGPVGRMLEATGRHPWRPAHIHIIVRAPGYKTVTTHVFDATSEYLDSDTVFAVKPSLLRTFVERSPDDPERPIGVDGEWVSLENDIVLASRRRRRRGRRPRTHRVACRARRPGPAPRPAPARRRPARRARRRHRRTRPRRPRPRARREKSSPGSGGPARERLIPTLGAALSSSVRFGPPDAPEYAFGARAASSVGL